MELARAHIQKGRWTQVMHKWQMEVYCIRATVPAKALGSLVPQAQYCHWELCSISAGAMRKAQLLVRRTGQTQLTDTCQSTIHVNLALSSSLLSSPNTYPTSSSPPLLPILKSRFPSHDASNGGWMITNLLQVCVGSRNNVLVCIDPKIFIHVGARMRHTHIKVLI